MKKLIVSTALAVCCFGVSSVKAQTVNNVRLSELKAEYIELRAIGRAFTDKIIISLEYGQKVIDLSLNTFVKDDNRKNLEFNSALDGVNKIKNYGYELFQVYTTQEGNKTADKIYVLKRK